LPTAPQLRCHTLSNSWLLGPHRAPSDSWLERLLSRSHRRLALPFVATKGRALREDVLPLWRGETAASWRERDGGRRRRTACPLICRFRLIHTYCPNSVEPVDTGALSVSGGAAQDRGSDATPGRKGAQNQVYQRAISGRTCGVMLACAPLYVSVVVSSQPPQDEDKPASRSRSRSRYIPPQLSPRGQSNLDISWERRLQVCPESSKCCYPKPSSCVGSCLTRRTVRHEGGTSRGRVCPWACVCMGNDFSESTSCALTLVANTPTQSEAHRNGNRLRQNDFGAPCFPRVPIFDRCFSTPTFPRINIGADVWGGSSIMTGVY
jgi:hypothetical protein